MFKKFLKYYRYQQSIKKWASTVSYQEKDIDWVFTWTDVSTEKTHQNLVVVFDRDLHIRGYTKIYTTNHLTILEKEPGDKRKVRFGIPEALHRKLLSYVRHVAEAHLANRPVPEITKAIPNEFHPYLNDSFMVDVGVWVDGYLRGSQQANSDDNNQAITAAIVRCINDQRLKPLMPTELERAIFEITIVPNIWLPVDTSLPEQLPPLEGTTRCQKFGNLISFYVPAVANTRHLHTLGEYLGSLIIKAQIESDKDIVFEYAPSYVAVEGKNDATIVLTGPHPKYVSNLVSEGSIQILKNNILRNIDTDGFILMVRNAENNCQMKFDVPRVGFVFYALSEYYGLTKDESVRTVLERVRNLLERVMRNQSNIALVTMARVYVNQAAMYVPGIPYQSLPDTQDDALMDSPLALSQHIKQRILKPNIAPAEVLACVTAVRELFLRWKISPPEKKCPIQFADLLWLLTYSNLTQEAEELANWFRSIQQPDGSFVALYRPRKAYTRGTGKVAEAAASVAHTRDIAEKALTYLRQMQYTDDTMYHIPKHLQDNFRGGFRHDAWNRDLWLDGSAHVLLVELRLHHASAYTGHLQTYLSAYRSALSKLDS